MGIFFAVEGIYLTIKSVMDLRNKNAAGGRCKAEYLYISCGFLIILVSGWYMMVAGGCSQNKNGYSLDPDDDNYCVFPLHFNHNAVLHVAQMFYWFVLFCGVWLETSANGGVETKYVAQETG